MHHCPTWKWQSGEKTKIKSYLPEGKQFLVTKNGLLLLVPLLIISQPIVSVCVTVPCLKRFKDVDALKFQEHIVDENDGDGGWVDTYFNEQKEINSEIIIGQEATEDLGSFANNEDTVQQAVDEDGDDSEAEDIENYLKRQEIDDDDDKVSLLHAFHLYFIISNEIYFIVRR